jgi:hypothetical protein
MGTVRGNLGTVLEHVVLASAVQWALEHSNPRTGPLLYVDTHAMAPLNEPVDRRFNFIREFLDGQHHNVVASSARGFYQYHHVLNTARQWWQDGLRDVYPTHFLQAAFASEAYGAAMDAWLFENDAVAAGRRAELAEFLSAERGPALQRDAKLRPGFMKANLAPDPGDFRDPNCWPPASKHPGRAMVVFCDPNQFAEHSTNPLHLTAQDLAMIRDLLAQRYLDRPSLTVNIIFIGASVRAEDCHNAMVLWIENFLPTGLATERYCWECRCIKWGNFGVLVGAWVTERTLSDTFDEVIQEIRDTLMMAYRRGPNHPNGEPLPEVIRPDPKMYPYPTPHPLAPLRKYLVRIYHHNCEELECDPIPAPGLLDEVSVLARAENEAAAKAYVRCIGLEQERRLIEWSAPHVVIAAKTDIKSLAEYAIVPSDGPFGQFKHDWGWDTWYFHVEESEQGWRD